MSDHLRWASAGETRAMIVQGDITAYEVAEAALARIDVFETRLQAFVTVDRDGALAAADALDAALSRGDAPGALHGVPVAIKDDLWVRDLPATCGSLLFAKFCPSHDGTVAERLRAAGAILVGKTNLPEFAAWPRSQSWTGGNTANPWDLTRISGASSGGSAAAVASGMVPVAIGTDGGGSIRIPAALNGIVGLFPTLGRVSGYGSFCCSPTESAGPMTRSVADAALVQQVIAGPDPRARHARIDPAPDVVSGLDDGVAGLRIGWSPDFGWIQVDPTIVSVAQIALSALRKAGAQVKQIEGEIAHPWGDGRWAEPLHRALEVAGNPSRPDRELLDPLGFEEWIGQCAAAGELLFLAPQFQALLRDNIDLLTPPQRAIAQGLGGGATPPADELTARFEVLLGENDVICSPTMATVAPVAPQSWASAYSDSFMGTHFTFVANTAGCPSITVPCGLADGLPVGFQIIGRQGDEATILRVARAVEQMLPPMPRPAL